MVITLSIFSVSPLNFRTLPPLIEAVRQNHRRVVELFLAAGLDASMTGSDGQAPYDYAQDGDNSEIGELLK